jgi:hypothetical protein
MSMPESDCSAPANVGVVPSASRERALIVALLVLGSVGFVARVGFALLARGTNDVETWARFAMQIAKHGVLYQYVHDAGFNHPPLMGWLARSILALSEATGIRFTFLFKLPMIAADLGTGALLAHAFLLRSGRRQGALAFALYGWSPISFLVSAHHGNTDCLCAMLVLASVVLSECHHARFAAGVVMGAAINVKLIPIFCVPALLFSPQRSFREYARFLLGLSLGAIPFVPVLIEAFAEFCRNALAYNSNRDNWGIPYFLRLMSLHPRFAPFAVPWLEAYGEIGRGLILFSVIATPLVFGPTGRLSAWSLTALSLALFLVIAPGFGVQYLVYVAPALFAVSPWLGFRYACLSGLFTGAVYFSFWDGSVPYYTLFVTRFPAATIPFGIVVWAWLAGFVGQTIAEGLSRRTS